MRHGKARSGSWLPTLVMAVLLAALCINVLSAYIRHVESGLDCADWPDCYGLVGEYVGLDSRQEVTRQALTPEPFAKRTHRLVATLLVVMVLVLLHRSRQGPRSAGINGQLPMIMAALLLLLAVIGPASYLKTRPAIASFNLLGGVALAAVSWRLWLYLAATPQSESPRWLRRLVVGGLACLCGQLALGAWVSANFAGLGCPELLSCGNGAGMLEASNPPFSYFRELSLDANGRVIADAAAGLIHRVHRLGAMLTAVVLLLCGLLAARHVRSSRHDALALTLLLLLQLSLGALAVTGSLPLLMVLGHNLVASLLLLAMIRLHYRLQGTQLQDVRGRS